MRIHIVSKYPDLVPHKDIDNVKSFVVDSEGITVVVNRKVIGLTSEYFKFGDIFLGCSYDTENQRH